MDNILNVNGQHLERYLKRKASVVRSLCDQLLLHDQILIPTQDYLTAAGLVRILGERNVLSLLDEERLQFVRLRGAFGYAQGTGKDNGLMSYLAPRVANSLPLDQSIHAGLSVIRDGYTEHDRLTKLLMAHTQELELSTVLEAVRKDAYSDLQQTALWKEEYRYFDPNFLALPGLGKMQVRVIGPGTDATTNVVDTCLTLGLMNIELYLAKQFDCASSSTGSPMGDCIALKLPRLMDDDAASKKLWSFLDIAGVPDFSGALLADQEEMAKFIKLTRQRDADAFKQWCNENRNLTEKEFLKAYIAVLHQTPWIQNKSGRALRMVASLGLGALGLGFLVDAIASGIDNFVVDKFVRTKGVKFFVEDLR